MSVPDWLLALDARVTKCTIYDSDGTKWPIKPKLDFPYDTLRQCLLRRSPGQHILADKATPTDPLWTGERVGAYVVVWPEGDTARHALGAFHIDGEPSVIYLGKHAGTGLASNASWPKVQELLQRAAKVEPSISLADLRTR